MTVTGHRLYRGVGDLSNVDFDAEISFAAAGETTITADGAAHAASTKYTYVLRPVVADLETPDLSCAVEFETDSDGKWVGLRPPACEYLQAEILSGGQVKLRWGFRTVTGRAACKDFGVYYSTAPDITLGTPDETVTCTGNGRYAKTLTLSDATTYWFAVTARTTAGVESPRVEAGPCVADGTAPSTPTVYATTTFEPIG